MANVLPFQKRVRIVALLVEGTSIRSTSRLVPADKDTVMHLGAKVGAACQTLHDRFVRHVEASRVEIDEVWAFCQVKERRKRDEHPAWCGDAYTMFAIDPESKLLVSYWTGKRSPETAETFLRDLRARVVGKPQLSVDGWPVWPDAILAAFGPHGADVGCVVKEYGPGKYGRVRGCHKTVLFGAPNPEYISTAIAERVNLTTRSSIKRLARRTNAHSKIVPNLRASIAMHFLYYNFVRTHDTLGTTPAVAAGITVEAWTLERLVRAALNEAGI